MGLKRQHWMMIAAAVVVVVLLALAPRTPSGKAEANAASARVSEDPNSGSTPQAQGAGHEHGDAPTSKDPEVNAILAELHEALAHGQAPMAAITKLRDLADSRPENVEAQYHMALLSWQSGQYDKAMVRLKQVIALDPKNYPDAYAYLGQAYGTLDSLEKAVAVLETYKTLVTDTALINGADRYIQDIKNKPNH